MTLVSTSRKASPPIRALARGLAFALEGRYMARGKTGLRELVTLDTPLFLFSPEQECELSLRVFVDEQPIAAFLVTAYEERRRDGPMVRGLLASTGVREVLGSHAPATSLDDGWDLGFDGPQRLRYRLRLAPTADTNDD